jgi:hypothetical protein
MLLALLLRISDAARRPVTPSTGGSIAPPPAPANLHSEATEVIT